MVDKSTMPNHKILTTAMYTLLYRLNIHTYRQNPGLITYGGQFPEWCCDVDIGRVKGQGQGHIMKLIKVSHQRPCTSFITSWI